MGKSERPLTTLARRVAELQDQANEARFDRERGRARLIEADLGVGGDRAARGVRLRAPTSASAIRLVASLAAALLLAALAVGLVARPRAPIGFELGTIEAGVVGEWIAAPPSAELPIHFSDGSLLRLAPAGRARVVAVSAIGAEIALERGALDLSVVHRERTRWLVRVGPFQVHVIGTRFETSWDPVTEQFGVALREGAITISGPVVGDSRAVRAGERLTISTASRTIEVGSIDSATAPPASSDAPRVAPPAPDPVLVPIAPAPIAPSATVRAPDTESVAPKEQAGGGGAAALPSARHEAPGWAELALEAKYKDALAAAEREGFDAICGAASAHELHALGDAARLGGSGARAVQAFAALRKRFPGSPEAAAAAFILGRTAQDQSRDYAGAASWYARYLSEEPGGGFAAEAAGRLVEAEDRMGDEAGARRAAERYLAAYPKGSHAAYAKSVLARGSSSAPPGEALGRPGTIREP
jgi:ferric-dicitrate binding protein FerR (iron transport regulator)/TolA-binding protein